MSDTSVEMTEQDVQAFWGAHPCGESFVANADKLEYEAFFAEYDRFRYGREGHILSSLDSVAFRDREVLEVGLGLGADSEQIVRRGGRWSGIDLTAESVERVKTRFALRGLPYERIECGSVLELPFEDDSFDVIFSHGVLHHVPDIHSAQSELARVLRPGGEAIVMLYAKYSLNYLVSIAMLRRLGLVVLYAAAQAGMRVPGIYGEHVDNARRVGLGSYLSLERFVHHNTDGPENPFSRVYGLSEIRRDFPAFEVVGGHKQFLHAPPLPLRGSALERFLGWHLWVRLRLA